MNKGVNKEKNIYNEVISQVKRSSKRTLLNVGQRSKAKCTERQKRDLVDRLVQDMGTLYRIKKTLSGGFESTDTPVRKQDGKLA